MKNYFYAIVSVFFIAGVINAQQVTNTINFTADISGILGIGAGGAFDPGQDSLLVMGLDWDGLGQNVIGNRTMVQDPFNPGIFTTTLSVTSGPGLGEGDSTKWKYKAFPDDRFSNSGWETGLDRWIVYQQDGAVIDLPVIIPRIYPLFDPLQNDVEITFNVDMSDPVNVYNGEHIDPATLEFVGMRGGADWLGNWFNGGCWCPDDTNGNPPLMYLLTEESNNIWSRTVTVLAGTNGGVFEYKYAMMYLGALNVNGGINPLDNEGGFGVNHALILNNTSPSPFIINDVFGSFEDPHIPVELKSFTAALVDKIIALNWSTATETNNFGFEINRKIVGEEESEWITIGFREGHGTTTTPQEYNYLDNIEGIIAESFVYRLKQVDYNGSFEFSEEISVENIPVQPREFYLSQNYPNPFNPSTTIKFSLPYSDYVTLKIYNELGEEVAVLLNKEITTGNYEIEWNANEIPSGVYFYQLKTESFIQTKKMILLR